MWSLAAQASASRPAGRLGLFVQKLRQVLKFFPLPALSVANRHGGKSCLKSVVTIYSSRNHFPDFGLVRCH